jgi:hypothetical protein
MARAVWALMDDDLVDLLRMDETPDPKLWLMSLCTNLSQRKFVQVLVTLWEIWWARRRAIHEDEFQNPLSTHCFITAIFNGSRLDSPGEFKTDVSGLTILNSLD